jgi:hypothetical protein
MDKAPRYDFGHPRSNDRADAAIETAELYWRTNKVKIISFDGKYGFGEREVVIYDMGRIRCYCRYVGQEAAAKRKENRSEYDFSCPWHMIKEIIPIGKRYV